MHYNCDCRHYMYTACGVNVHVYVQVVNRYV